MEEFKSYLEEKEYSVNTIKQYTSNMKKYFDNYGDPTDNNQKQIIENIENIKLYDTRNKKEVQSINGRTQLIKSIISFLKYKNKPFDKISALFTDINKQASIDAKLRNEKLNEKLMSFKEYNDKVNDLYETNEPEKLRQFVINKLLIMSNCRNADLICKIITSKQEHDDMDTDKNYLYVDDEGDVYFIRNLYKTSSTYGNKITKIKSKKMTLAIRILKLYTNEYDDYSLIPVEYHSPSDKLSRYIKRMTFDLGEVNILKIMLRENNTLSKAKKISVNRGTSLHTLQENYNLVQ